MQHYSFRIAIVLSALLFAVAHLNLLQGVTAFLLGLILGWVYFRTRSLYPVMFIYGFNNLIFLIVNRYLYITGYWNIELYQPAWVTLLGVILVTAGLFILSRKLDYVSEDTGVKNTIS